ncbi:MAG TPA: PHP domain-containing protein [Acidobacteriota bacterium]|nr:PHP domain-containing protein [Acidobacteriota bacterium]
MNGYDLHTHTCYSFDCDASLDAYVAAVTASGLTGVAVTDHDTIEGALRLRDRNPPFDVIVGCEITLASGAHIIGLFLEQPIQGGWLADTAAAIRAQGGLVLLPHPYRRETGALAETCPSDDISALMVNVDLIEVFNAKSPPAENKRAAALAKTWKRRGAAGSDAHGTASLGQGRIRLSGLQRQLSAHRLLREPVRVVGIDQSLPEVERTHRRREGVRRLALRFRKQVPETVWRWGKRRWDRMCDQQAGAHRWPFREYARFTTRISADADDEVVAASPAESVGGGEKHDRLAAGRGTHGNR